jgi:hypothetical protein
MFQPFSTSFLFYQIFQDIALCSKHIFLTYIWDHILRDTPPGVQDYLANDLSRPSFLPRISSISLDLIHPKH